MTRHGRPDSDAAVSRLPERLVDGAAGSRRGVVRLREVGEDEILEPVRRKGQRHLRRFSLAEYGPLRNQSGSWFASSTTASAPLMYRKTFCPASPRSVAIATSR